MPSIGLPPKPIRYIGILKSYIRNVFSFQSEFRMRAQHFGNMICSATHLPSLLSPFSVRFELIPLIN